MAAQSSPVRRMMPMALTLWPVETAAMVVAQEIPVVMMQIKLMAARDKRARTEQLDARQVQVV